MKGAMVVTWTGIRPGRERLALKYGRDVDEYWGKFAADGKCSPPKWYLAHSGPNVWVVEGEVEDLLGISTTEQAQKLTAEGPLVCENFTQEFCMSERDEQFRMFEEVLDGMKV
jgi:hypothetical protein